MESVVTSPQPDPEDVDARLARIDAGLSQRVLHSTARAWREARRRATGFHPPLTGPFNSHADATATIRMLLMPFGWKVDNKDGYPRTINASDREAIAVASGCERTGMEGDPEPTTSSPKGTCTERAILENLQGALYDTLAQDEKVLWLRRPNEPGEHKPQRTWILLIHEDGDETRMELSLPSVWKGKRPIEWTDRIILSPLRNDDDHDVPDYDAPDDTPDLDVPVTRRTV